MKLGKWIICLIFLLNLIACSGESSSNSSNTFNFTVEEFEGRVVDALKQMGDETGLKVVSSNVNEDGKHVIQLSDSIMFFIEVDEEEKNINDIKLAALANQVEVNKNDLLFSFKLLVGTVDNSLTDGKRSEVINELELNSADLLNHQTILT